MFNFLRIHIHKPVRRCLLFTSQCQYLPVCHGLLADGRADVKKRIVFVKKEEEIKHVKWLKHSKKVPKNREPIRQS